MLKKITYYAMLHCSKKFPIMLNKFNAPVMLKLCSLNVTLTAKTNHLSSKVAYTSERVNPLSFSTWLIAYTEHAKKYS